MELGKSFVPFSFGGYADNILPYANEEQKQRYLIPTLAGERKSSFAPTEPGAGLDAKAIRTLSGARRPRAWIINGEKTFITGGNNVDFAMVFAVNRQVPEHVGWS